MMAKPKEILALHRYFFWARTMRGRFGEERGKARTDEELKNAHFLAPYLPYYLAGMYTLVEGWRRLKLRDAEVDALLLDAGRLKVLEAFRHGVYHFHPESSVVSGHRVRMLPSGRSGLFAAFDKFFRRWFTRKPRGLKGT
jgi:hypothetical protein